MVDLHAPALEMLWEARDPHEVLMNRFAFADAASAGHWVAATVQEHWDVQVESCDRIVMSDHNALAWITASADRLLAKWSSAHVRFTRLTEVARLTQWLDQQRFPVAAPISSLGEQPQVETDHGSMCLQPVVPGQLLDVNDDIQVHAAGAALADLHQLLGRYPDADRVNQPEAPPRSLATRVTDWVNAAGGHIPQVARDTLVRLVADAPADSPPTQLVHGDYRSSNILFADRDIAAVIDFEEARIDYCIDEMARSATMLGTRFRDWGPVSNEVRATFLAGYRRVRQLTAVEESWLEVLLLWYAFALVPPGDDPTGWGSAALSQLAEHTHGNV